MKKALLISFIITCCLCLLALSSCNNKTKDNSSIIQNTYNSVNSTAIQEDTSIDDEPHFQASSRKTTVTEVTYHEVTPYLSDRIVVRQGDLYGIIDNLGNIVMPIMQPYPIEPLNMTSVMFVDNNKFGVLSLDGNVLLPAIYDDIRSINDDLLQLDTNNTYEKNGKLYLDINKVTHEFYSVKNNKFLGIKLSGQLTNATASSKFIVITWSDTSSGEQMDYMGVYDAQGNEILFEESDNEPIICKTSNNNEYAVFSEYIMDSKGDIIYDISNQDSTFYPHFINTSGEKDKIILEKLVRKEGRRPFYDYYVYNLTTHNTRKINNLPETTQTIREMPNGFYEIGIWPENSSSYYYGLMNDKYEIILEPIYDRIGKYMNGYFSLEIEEHWGYADENGTVVPPQIHEDELADFCKFSHNWSSNNGALINPRTGQPLPYEKADLIDDNYYYTENIESRGIFEAVLTDQKTNEKYKSFVTWDGPVVDHKFPNTRITVSNDGKLAVYNKGTLYTIVEIY